MIREMILRYRILKDDTKLQELTINSAAKQKIELLPSRVAAWRKWCEYLRGLMQ